MLQRWIVQKFFNNLQLVGIAVTERLGTRLLYRVYNSAHSHMRPNDGGFWMTPQHGLHLFKVDRHGACFCHWHIHVVVKDYRQSHLSGKIENAIQCRVGEAGCFASYFGGNELFMYAEFTNA